MSTCLLRWTREKREPMKRPERLPTAERRRQIAEAALRIISDRGVSRLTAMALAKEVGIADGTIFRHFKDKQEIVNTAIGLFETALESTFPPPDGEPLERLGTFLVKRLTLVRKNPELPRLALNDRLAEAAGAEGSARVKRLVGRSVTVIHDCLAEAQSRGQVSQEVPVTFLTWMVIGVIRGASTPGAHNVPGQTPLSDTSPEEVWTTLERFLRAGALGSVP